MSGLALRTILFTLGEGVRRQEPEIDVLIPVTRKDWPSLKQAIEAARKCIRHPINKFYVVSREAPFDGRVSLGDDVVFRDEGEVAPLRKSAIDYAPGGVDRSGWLFQQFIKLACDTFCERDHVLALDADTVLLRPQRFVRNGRIVMNVSQERHVPYYRAIQRLLPGMPISPYSFVSHHMLFTRRYLGELKQALESTGKGWVDAILGALDRTEWSGFSEYELYGHFVAARHSGRICLQHFLNVGFGSERIGTIPYIKIRHPLMKSASFHSR